jgi:hypothetical protein
LSWKLPVSGPPLGLVDGRAVRARNFAGQFWRSSPTKEQVLAVEALRGRSRRDSAFRQAVLGFLQLFLAADQPASDPLKRRVNQGNVGAAGAL